MTSARNLPDWEGEFALGAALEQALGTRTRLGNTCRWRTDAEAELGNRGARTGNRAQLVGKRIEELRTAKEAAEINSWRFDPVRPILGP